MISYGSAVINGTPSIPIRPDTDKRRMVFVDGENFTIRAESVMARSNLTLEQGDLYEPGTLVWIPGYSGTDPWNPLGEFTTAIRAYYYTSVFEDPAKPEDAAKLEDVTNRLWMLGFSPLVFRKKKQAGKAKGVDIAMTKDLLSHAFLNNYDVAVVIAGDGDYVPVIEEVKRLGKIVYIVFFESNGLNGRLKQSADWFYSLEKPFVAKWRQYLQRSRSQ